MLRFSATAPRSHGEERCDEDHHIAALLLIGVVTVPAAPAQATFHAKNGRPAVVAIAAGDVGSVAPTVGIPCDELVVARC
jgi:hypothetical protein